ncbi:hypothetical protein FRB93_012879 [Tulasnella sp. JGI-2019a]|nr:hypothetical protein FRB93_012879 [Tulasnella sp. JGI-2019a]
MPRPPDPPWKVKTRPCPFFTRGTCLFASSCNFVHTVKSPIAPEIRVSVPTQDYYGIDDDYETNLTPPNVTSPSFEYSPPNSNDLYASNILSPSPETTRGRPRSWASIRSIQSAASNLTYPTDPSPTASRVSSREDEDEDEMEDTKWSYNAVQELLGNIEFGILPKRDHSLESLRNESPPPKARPTILIPSPLPEPLVKPLGKQLSFPPSMDQEQYDPQKDLLTANTSTSLASSSRMSDPNAQVLAVHTPKLGEPLNLDPPKRRLQTFRERNVFDIDMDPPRPPSPPPAQPTPHTQRETQLSLNEVLINVLDPSLRPRRINRIMQGLSPETPLNSVAQSATQATELQPVQPAFEGHGNAKSEAFRLHLANVISNTAAQRDAPRRRRKAKILQPPIDLSSPAKIEAAGHQLDVLESLQNNSLAAPDSACLVMKEAMSPDGMSPAFRRPGRPAQARRPKGERPSPATPSNLHIPSHIVDEIIATTPPPPRFSPREEEARMGSLTLTPLTDSPIDFRRDNTRIGFSLMEDQDAEAALDVVGGYDDTAAKDENPSRRRASQLYETPRAPTSRPASLRKSSRISSLVDVSHAELPPQEVPPPEVRIPSPTTPTPTEGEQAELYDNASERQDDVANDAMTMPPLSPTTHSKLRPLRLSLLFDQMKTPHTRSNSISSIDPSGSRSFARRPLTALLEPPIEVPPEFKELNPNDSTPLASRTVRRRRSRNLQTESSPNVSRTTTGLFYVKNTNLPGADVPIRRTRSSKRMSPAPTGELSSSPSQMHFDTNSQSYPDPQTRSRHISRPSLITKSVSFENELNLISPQVYIPEPSPHPYRHQRNHSHSSTSSISSASTSSAVSKPPLLFWALASDNVSEVERLLASGEATANDKAGPDDLPALLFTMQNEALKNRTEIVKTLLAYGADPSVLQELASSGGQDLASSSESDGPVDEEGDEEGRRDSMTTVKGVQKRDSRRVSDQVKRDRRMSRRITMGMNPAIDYYMTRMPELPPKQLEALRKAGFDPLTRTPFHMVGQDLVLQELLRVLARHAQRDSTTPVSIIFAGPSGHGKSLLSRNIGELLRIPAHTVNMTNLRSQEEFMESRSLTTTQADMKLARFLSMHEGKRCAVILEEIEKVADKSASNTLLMPWEVGKLNTTAAIYDTSRVIWIATSNAGEDIVFDFEQQLGGRPCERNEYLDLGTRVRRKLIENLGASLVSRVTTILPFLAFTEMEKTAIAYQHLPTNTLPKDELDALLGKVLQDYVASEGVRSIQRAVQRHYEEDLW